MSKQRNFQVEGRKARGAGLPLFAVTLLSAGSALFAPSCLKRHAEPNADQQAQRCAGCHGDASRAGDYLLRSAPPRDLLGQSSPSYPGVGAHALHLNAGPTHAALACSECHVVPDEVRSPGHADDARPAELVFGELSKTGRRHPAYDSAKRSCSGSYCHRDATPVWTEPRESDAACGSCHGLPPAAPHPQSARCSACHGDVLDAKRHFIAPERHVDGVVDAKPGACDQCHGSADSPAPPLDTQGHSLTSALGVGAHQAHLTGGAFGRPLACTECHSVPDESDAPSHIGGLPAKVELTGVALSEGREASFDHDAASCSDNWCHAPGPDRQRPTPVWTSDASLGCGSCHGLPPAAPHPQASDCSRCHAAVVGADNRSIVDKLRHVDGVVDVRVDEECTSCHGNVNAAPPSDLSGSSLTSDPGVGAHQTHVLGTANSRAVPCAECHIVPGGAFDVGHFDSALPAEVVFSGTALAHGGAPLYRQGKCESSGCHGAVFPQGHASGGSNTRPIWTKVDGTQASCGTCHGLPPPPPHVAANSYPCHTCHQDLADDDVSFTHPELHVDGQVTFEVR